MTSRALFSELRALDWIHRSFHWMASGPHFYQDHLLFKELYEATEGEIDAFAEKLVGTDGIDAVSPVESAREMTGYVSAALSYGAVADTLISTALDAEKRFLRHIADVMAHSKPSDGWQNLLQGIADRHETHVYLLQQRLHAVKLAALWGATIGG